MYLITLFEWIIIFSVYLSYIILFSHIVVSHSNILFYFCKAQQELLAEFAVMKMSQLFTNVKC